MVLLGKNHDFVVKKISDKTIPLLKEFLSVPENTQSSYQGLWEKLYKKIHSQTLEIEWKIDETQGLNILLIAPDLAFFLSTLEISLEKADIFQFNRIQISQKDNSLQVLPCEDAYCQYQQNMICVALRWQEKQTKTAALKIIKLLRHSYMQVAQVNHDKESLFKIANEIRAHHKLEEARKFFQWLLDDNFTFLGHFLVTKSGAKTLKLGITKNREFSLTSLFLGSDGQKLKQLLDPHSKKIRFAKSSLISPIHRKVALDIIVIQNCSRKGGIHCFIGLYTSVAYSTSKQRIPLIRQKIDQALVALNINPHWYEGRVLQHLIDTLPQDEIFQCDQEVLEKIAQMIHTLHRTDNFGLIAFPDPLKRYTNIILYIPNRSFDTSRFSKAQKIIQRGIHCDLQLINASLDFTSYGLAHFRTQKSIPLSALKKIEKPLSDLFDAWQQTFEAKLFSKETKVRAQEFLSNYGSLFTSKYQAATTTDEAFIDLEYLDRCYLTGQRQARFYIHPHTKSTRLKIYNPDTYLILSDIFVTLENFGFRVISESAYSLTLPNQKSLWIHDMGLEIKPSFFHAPAIGKVDFANVVSGFQKVWLGWLDDTYFNALMTVTSVNWQQCVLIKALSNYLRQLGFNTQDQTLKTYVESYSLYFQHICELFEVLHSPHKTLKSEERKNQTTQLIYLCQKYLKNIQDIEHERWLRCLLNVVVNTLRTNFFFSAFCDDQKPCLGLKINSANVDEAPEPKPYREIFVYNLDFEGVHLRSDKVARGGIRWSDRREDYRTEILGLLTAQIVKNSIIVPAGAKGGFVVKKQPKEFESYKDFHNYVVVSYQKFIQALLDLTDNLYKKTQSHEILKYDEFDPYLVVAADKGTASFSDFANEISLKNKFWLGDAFASGGRHGYSHKALGITAKGAWESVKHHFMMQKINVQTDSIRVVGVGDMSGDVFGNGMLCSDKIQLIAAFDHRHIFIDPAPNPEKSFKERQRLFQLSQSSWADYNPDLISKGGGIFARTDKQIRLTPAMKEALDIHENSAHITANALIRHILKAHVDLLWFGGIGTFICASYEDTYGVQDPINNHIRISAKDVRSKVIVEGANLPITQLGRIEFSQKGGIINTDSIDNSAGVNCSDYEVNLKILFQKDINKKKISLAERNTMLIDMSDEVVRLVLENNIQQNKLLTLLETKISTGHNFLPLKLSLESQGYFTPEKKSLSALNTLSTRPELALLISHAKNYIYDQLVDNNHLNSVMFDSLLKSYFPLQIQEKYLRHIRSHPLRKNILATLLANKVVNAMGVDFPIRIQENTQALWLDIVQVWWMIYEHLTFQKSLLPTLENLEIIETLCVFVLRNYIHKVYSFRKTPHLLPQAAQQLSCFQDSLFWLHSFLNPKQINTSTNFIDFVIVNRWDALLLSILPGSQEFEAEKRILQNILEEILLYLLNHHPTSSVYNKVCMITDKAFYTTKPDSFSSKVELGQTLLRKMRK